MMFRPNNPPPLPMDLSAMSWTDHGIRERAHVRLGWAYAITVSLCVALSVFADWVLS